MKFTINYLLNVIESFHEISTKFFQQIIQNTGHKKDFENAITASRDTTLRAYIIRQTIEIEKRPDCFNKRDDSQRPPLTWKMVRGSLVFVDRRANQRPSQLQK